MSQTTPEELAGHMSVTGTMVYCQYDRTTKAIRMVIDLPDGGKAKVEEPYTKYTFRPGMNVDQEMEKLAELIRKKCLGKFGTQVVSTAQPHISGMPGLSEL